MNNKYSIFLFIFLLFGISTNAMVQPIVDAPKVVLTDIPFEITVTSASSQDFCNYSLELNDAIYTPENCSDSDQITFSNLVLSKKAAYTARLSLNGQVLSSNKIEAVWGWVSILPPVASIIIALLFRSVIPALFFGIWIGSFAILGFNFRVVWQSFLDVIATYVKSALANADHAAIIIFSLMIGGLVGIISKNGGMYGVVNSLLRFTTNPKRGQVITATMGLAIFFDDYANTLVVGNTMRKITDKLKISRAKLAFLVDATAAPVACIALITTWVGFQLGMIDASIQQIDAVTESAYLIYLKSIAYSFYPIFMLVFVMTIAGTGRDFSSMYKFETESRIGRDPSIQSSETGYSNTAETDRLEPKDPSRARAFNAVIPIVLFIGSVIGGLFVTGEGNSVQEIIGSADAYKALLWGSMIAVVSAVLLTLVQGIMSLEEAVQSWYEGVKFMVFAIIVLIMAWSLAETTELLQTANYLSSILDELLPVALVPTTIFILAAATAFATGTSWGTMGIFYPIVVPLVWQILSVNGVADPEHFYILYSSIACVLCGAVWGDHCSPISDTTIMSSMASGCDHIDHVTTQLPYALVVASIALLLGTLPTGFGVPAWLMILIGIATVVSSVFILGKKVD
ncbi:MAG TPA: Na+/H+ antiporter NhaC family protein [Gammaproteobacteria bacterium]|jgi:Na+/H+ antiporter NhaC|nr:Na+/H+ antiporter NhaC family protein [Gammaproteobacteria bacterium]